MQVCGCGKGRLCPRLGHHVGRVDNAQAARAHRPFVWVERLCKRLVPCRVLSRLGQPQDVPTPMSICPPGAASRTALEHSMRLPEPTWGRVGRLLALGREVALGRIRGAPTRGASNVKAVTGTSGPDGWSLWWLMPDCTCSPVLRAQSNSCTSAVICNACYIQDIVALTASRFTSISYFSCSSFSRLSQPRREA
jgi:hypothetical protein